jgi:hypothetical protein
MLGLDWVTLVASALLAIATGFHIGRILCGVGILLPRGRGSCSFLRGPGDRFIGVGPPIHQPYALGCPVSLGFTSTTSMATPTNSQLFAAIAITVLVLSLAYLVLCFFDFCPGWILTSDRPVGWVFSLTAMALGLLRGRDRLLPILRSDRHFMAIRCGCYSFLDCRITPI